MNLFSVCRGITTYQWIQNSRERAERIASDKDIPEANYDANKIKTKVINTIGITRWNSCIPTYVMLRAMLHWIT